MGGVLLVPPSKETARIRVLLNGAGPGFVKVNKVPGPRAACLVGKGWWQAKRASPCVRWAHT